MNFPSKSRGGVLMASGARRASGAGARQGGGPRRRSCSLLWWPEVLHQRTGAAARCPCGRRGGAKGRRTPAREGEEAQTPWKVRARVACKLGDGAKQLRGRGGRCEGRGYWIEKKELAAAGVAALRAMASFFSFYKTKRSGLTKTGTAG